MATWNPWHILQTVRQELDHVFDDSGPRAAPAFRTAFLPGEPPDSTRSRIFTKIKTRSTWKRWHPAWMPPPWN